MGDAIDRARELSPDVLLLDAHLGPTRMLEAAKTLASDNPGVAVIYLCGEQRSRSRRRRGHDGDLGAPELVPRRAARLGIRLAAQRARAALGSRGGRAR
jgi:DNA-binding NarL/FixJ family response regulator